MLLWPALIAGGLYLLLRGVVWAPGSGTTGLSISQHGIWVGVIAWMVSSLQAAGGLGVIPRDASVSALMTPNSVIAALAWPVLGCLAIHALGQSSYPGPRSERRQAALSVRRIRDFIPIGLAWTVLAIFAATTGYLSWVARLPGYPPVPPAAATLQGEALPSSGADGRVPGLEVAAYLGSALLILAIGTVLVLWLITRRRQLEALDATDNDLLRTIAMNRLLRVVATVAAGLAAIAFNFAEKPAPALSRSDSPNAAVVGNLVILLLMLVWAPPKLLGAQHGATVSSQSAAAPASAHPAIKLSFSIGAALALVAVIAAIFWGFLLTGALSGNSYGPAGFAGLTATCILLALVGGELLLQRNYGSPLTPRSWPHQPVGPTLTIMAIASLALLLTVLGVTAAGEGLLDRERSWIPAAVVTAVVGLASLPVFLTARFRHEINTAVPGLNAALRAVTVSRIIRTLAAYLTAQSGVLLMTASEAWPPVLGYPPNEWQAQGSPLPLAGAVLLAAAVLLSATPVRHFIGKSGHSAPLAEAERQR